MKRVVFVTLLVARAAWAQEGLDEARLNLEKWLEAKRLIAQERADWRVQKELLADRVGVLEKELAAVCERSSQVTNEAAQLDQQFAEVRQQNDQLAAAAARMKDSVAKLEARLQPLLTRAPEPVRERIKPLVQRLPQDPAETKISLPERFQNVIGVLNELGRANGEVAVATEIRTLDDGRQAEVKTLYLGMGQAYYVSAKGDAGVGRPEVSGWVWRPAGEIAAHVTEAMQILQNKATPAFVPLPVSIP